MDAEDLIMIGVLGVDGYYAWYVLSGKVYGDAFAAMLGPVQAPGTYYYPSTGVTEVVGGLS